MNARMQEALLRVSTCFSLDPSVVFQSVLGAITSVYGDTLAIVNLLENDRLTFRAQRNVPATLKGQGFTSIPMLDSY